MNEVGRRCARNLRPAETGRVVESQLRRELVASVSEHVLLVRTGDDQGELTQALVTSLASPGVPLAAALGFRTVARSAPSARDIVELRDSLDPRALREKLRAWLSLHVAVLVPLRKREGSGKDFITRISVGRALNNDVVLRDESISKLHAWLEKDDDACFHVSDAGSRNGTFLNGARLPAKTPSLVPWGSELRFDAIVCTLWTAETLWDAIRTEG